MATVAKRHPDQDQAALIPQVVARVSEPIMIILPAAAKLLPLILHQAHTSMVVPRAITGTAVSV